MHNVYFNHDGNVDDLVSLLLLLQMPDVNLLGVGVTDADGYVVPAVAASRKIIDVFGGTERHTTVARSNSRPVHQFPKQWRVRGFFFYYFSIFNEKRIINTPLVKKPANFDLIYKII